MDIITRAEAKSKGLATYYTAVLCKQGHDSPKFTINYTCVACHEDRQRTSYQSNSEAIRAKRVERYNNDPETAAAKTRAWSRNNPDKVKERHRRDYSINKEAYKSRAAKRRAQAISRGTYTSADVLRQHTIQNRLCYYCDVPYLDKFHIDHYIPLARGGRNDWTNIVVACEPCNRAKWALMPDEFIERLRLNR